MKASEIAKIEDVNERVEKIHWFLLSLSFKIKKISLFIIVSDVLNQEVTLSTIAIANAWWKSFDDAKKDYPEIDDLPPIVKLIANHNPDFQPGEEAFVLLDEMVSVEA